MSDYRRETIARCGAAQTATWTCLERCDAPAEYMSPAGFRCAAHAEQEMSAIRDGTCLLAVYADALGKTRESFIAAYKRLT